MNDSIFDPPVAPENLTGARTLVLNGIMQSNLDARGFQILNLDTSNLSISPLNTQHAPAHQWYNGYDQGTNLLTSTQPQFSDLGGYLTGPQQVAIHLLGVVNHGTWASTDGPIDGQYLPTLDLLRPPGEPVDMNQHRIINLKDPLLPQDAVNLRTMQVLNMGFQPKNPIKAATIATHPLIGLDPVDGYTPVEADRILVHFQTDKTQNGIYDAHSGAWTRSIDADTGPKLVGAIVWTQFGTLFRNIQWYQQTPSPLTLGVSNIIFIAYSNVTLPTFGQGLQLTGTTVDAVGTPNRIVIGTGIDIDPAYVGQASITTLGIVTTGTWNAGMIDGQHGGTGVSNIGKTLTLGGSLTTVGGSIQLQVTGSATLSLPLAGVLATIGGSETFTNKHISASQVDTGVFPLARGGTGAATATLALNNLLPLQTGHAGQSLKTDGTNVFWG
jgi:hypothetical protein